MTENDIVMTGNGGNVTKKHFIALADYIRLHNKYVSSPDTEFNAGHLKTLADFCKSTNGQFNRERWLGYIEGTNGPSGGSIKAPKPYQPKTGERCNCKPGVQRDNCPECEGTGMRIDFAAIRNR